MPPRAGASSSSFLTGGFTSLPLPRKNDQTIDDKFGQQIKKLFLTKIIHYVHQCVLVCVGVCVGERERESVCLIDKPSKF